MEDVLIKVAWFGCRGIFRVQIEGVCCNLLWNPSDGTCAVRDFGAYSPTVKMSAKVVAVSATASTFVVGELEAKDDDNDDLSRALCKALDIDGNGCVTLNDIVKFLYFSELGLPFEWKKMKACLCELRKFGTGEINHVNKTIDTFAQILSCDRKDVATKVATVYKTGWDREIGRFRERETES